MAEKTPVTTTTTTGYVDPRRGIPGQTRVYLEDTNKLSYYFDNIDDADTWPSGFGARVVDHAFKVTSAGTVSVSESAGTFTFGASAVDQTVYLHVWLSRN